MNILGHLAKVLGKGGEGEKSNEEALWLRQERLKRANSNFHDLKFNSCQIISINQVS